MVKKLFFISLFNYRYMPTYYYHHVFTCQSNRKTKLSIKLQKKIPSGKHLILSRTNNCNGCMGDKKKNKIIFHIEFLVFEKPKLLLLGPCP